MGGGYSADLAPGDDFRYRIRKGSQLRGPGITGGRYEIES
jgi:hypothetical protein